MNDRKHWIERLIEISNEIDETESLGSMSSRAENSKRSSDDHLTWTNSYDRSINENNFQNEVIIKKLLENQKLARQSAKMLSDKNLNKQERIYVDPL